MSAFLSNKLWRGALAALMILGLILPTGGAKASADEQSGGPGTYQPGACAFDLPLGFESLRDVECGTLTVPADYSNPQGATITLDVATLRTRSATPAPQPLVMMQGGPGGSTLEVFPSILMTGALLQSDYDIILFDQRGTLYSSPDLSCAESYDLTLRTLDQKLTDEEALKLSTEALTACRDRLQADGVNLGDFNSIQNAHDVDALRQALGYQQIDLYGVSYGTLLALHVMRLHPDGLRAVILDSVLPTQRNTLQDGLTAQNRALETLFNACASDTTCNNAYPNLRDEFYKVVDRYNAASIHRDLTDSDTGKSYPALIDGDTLLYAVIQMLYSTEFIPLLPRVIYDARAGNLDMFVRILGLVVFDRSLSEGMHYAVYCADDGDFDPSDVPTNLPPQLMALQANSMQSYAAACKLWNVPLEGPLADEPVQSDIPTLVLAGAFDPATPPEDSALAAETLTNSFLINFPKGGHGEAMGNPCGDEIVLQFLDNPSRQPDSTCTGTTGPEFVTRSSLVSVPVLGQMVNLEGATGWQLALFAGALLILLGAWLVYPIVWLVRLIRKPDAPQHQVDQYGGHVIAAEPPKRAVRPLVYIVGKWLAVLTGGVLLVFFLVTAFTVVSMASQNDLRVLMGLPGSARMLFLLPPLALVGTFAMTLICLLAWTRHWGSAWGRAYFTLLWIAAVVCVAILGVWGMLWAILR